MNIERKSASIETLSVTINALQVNNKQMTVAVFRQLPVADAYNDDGSLASFDYWGLVNYAVKDQGNEWVVCANDSQLYRCALFGDYTVDNEMYAKNTLRRLNHDIARWSEARADWEERHAQCKKIGLAGESWDMRCQILHLQDLVDLEDDAEDQRNFLANCKRAENTFAMLLRLPQLFIAV